MDISSDSEARKIGQSLRIIGDDFEKKYCEKHENVNGVLSLGKRWTGTVLRILLLYKDYLP